MDKQNELFKSAVYMILNQDGKVLIQKRKNTKQWPNYYALPAGHIDRGENQYDAVIREAKEELGIELKKEDIINEYVVLRRNYFDINGKKLESYIDYYFEFKNFIGTPKILEEDKCEELLWVDLNNLPEPFVNYIGEFLNNKEMKTYDCIIEGKYTIENFETGW